MGWKLGWEMPLEWAQTYRWSLWLGFGPDWICLNDRPWTESGFRRPTQWLKSFHCARWTKYFRKWLNYSWRSRG